MRHPALLHTAGWLGTTLLLAGCLATPPAQPPVVSTSERRANYQGALTAVVVLGPATEAQAQRGAPDTLTEQAMRRRLREAGVPALAVVPATTATHWRHQGASHSVRISLPASAEGRTAVHVELRDTLTRSVVWRYAGELDTGSRPPPRQVAERMADAVIHRLREDGLLAR
jgi:hypothetical protein